MSVLFSPSECIVHSYVCFCSLYRYTYLVLTGECWNFASPMVSPMKHVHQFYNFFFILFNINEWIHHATRQYEKPKGNAEPKVKLFWTKTLKKEVLPGPSKRLAEEQQRRNLWSNIIRLPSHTLFVHFCRVSGRAALLRSKTQKYPADISADENDCTATVQGNQQSI